MSDLLFLHLLFLFSSQIPAPLMRRKAERTWLSNKADSTWDTTRCQRTLPSPSYSRWKGFLMIWRSWETLCPSEGATRQLADVGWSCVWCCCLWNNFIWFIKFYFIFLCFPLISHTTLCIRWFQAELIIHELTESVVVSIILHQIHFHVVLCPQWKCQVASWHH